ncbi:MAG: hypothetical protein ACPGJF_03300 [Sinimarinibacterium flocculans]|uniref:hypothetical protein n=1 Tax=Sinimarinibacterium flocculans TaxID=985250 RepID=UPI003C425282
MTTTQLTDAELTREIRELLERERLRQWVRSCLSKCRYSSANRANAAVRRARLRRRVVLRTYYCEHCGGWHLTKQVQR